MPSIGEPARIPRFKAPSDLFGPAIIIALHHVDIVPTTPRL